MHGSCAEIHQNQSKICTRHTCQKQPDARLARNETEIWCKLTFTANFSGVNKSRLCRAPKSEFQGIVVRDLVAGQMPFWSSNNSIKPLKGYQVLLYAHLLHILQCCWLTIMCLTSMAIGQSHTSPVKTRINHLTHLAVDRKWLLCCNSLQLYVKPCLRPRNGIYLGRNILSLLCAKCILDQLLHFTLLLWQMHRTPMTNLQSVNTTSVKNHICWINPSTLQHVYYNHKPRLELILLPHAHCLLLAIVDFDP